MYRTLQCRTQPCSFATVHCIQRTTLMMPTLRSVKLLISIRFTISVVTMYHTRHGRTQPCAFAAVHCIQCKSAIPGHRHFSIRSVAYTYRRSMKCCICVEYEYIILPLLASSNQLPFCHVAIPPCCHSAMTMLFIAHLFPHVQITIHNAHKRLIVSQYLPYNVYMTYYNYINTIQLKVSLLNIHLLWPIG